MKTSLYPVHAALGAAGNPADAEMLAPSRVAGEANSARNEHKSDRQCGGTSSWGARRTAAVRPREKPRPEHRWTSNAFREPLWIRRPGASAATQYGSYDDITDIHITTAPGTGLLE